MIRVMLAFLFLTLAAAGVGAQGVDEDFRLEPGDQIAISVLEDPGLNTTVLVRPDGRISMPLAGTLLVEGRTPESVAAAITRALSDDFLAPPTVTVSLLAVGGGRPQPVFYALGEVGNPGSYPFEPPLSLLQALALIGGPSPFAATDRIQVRRNRELRDEVLLFDLDVVEEGLAPVNEITIQDGDVIVVPLRGLFE